MSPLCTVYSKTAFIPLLLDISNIASRVTPLSKDNSIVGEPVISSTLLAISGEKSRVIFSLSPSFRYVLVDWAIVTLDTVGFIWSTTNVYMVSLRFLFPALSSIEFASIFTSQVT